MTSLPAPSVLGSKFEHVIVPFSSSCIFARASAAAATAANAGRLDCKLGKPLLPRPFPRTWVLLPPSPVSGACMAALPRLRLPFWMVAAPPPLLLPLLLLTAAWAIIWASPCFRGRSRACGHCYHRRRHRGRAWRHSHGSASRLGPRPRRRRCCRPPRPSSGQALAAVAVPARVGVAFAVAGIGDMCGSAPMPPPPVWDRGRTDAVASGRLGPHLGKPLLPRLFLRAWALLPPSLASRTRMAALPWLRLPFGTAAALTPSLPAA